MSFSDILFQYTRWATSDDELAWKGQEMCHVEYVYCTGSRS
jgi:hypothetical protein